MPKPWKKNLKKDDDGSRPRTLHAAVVVETLDLHGYTGDEAEDRLELFFDRVTRTSAGGVVRIVTGRGARSQGPPVLQAVVRDALNGWLAEHVAEWAVDVGGGAYLVRVRG
ncbi:MAG: Smr/MutS family protein [Longimicrobiales bacterium]